MLTLNVVHHKSKLDFGSFEPEPHTATACPLAFWSEQISALTGLRRDNDIKKPYKALITELKKQGD